MKSLFAPLRCTALSFAILTLLAVGNFLLGCSDNRQQARIDELESTVKELKADKEQVQQRQERKRRPEKNRAKIEIMESDSALLPGVTSEQLNEEWNRKQEEKRKIGDEIKGITVVVDDYDSDGVGHLFNIVLKLENPTKYHFEYIAVDVTYIKLNQEVYKTEKVYFYNVEAYSTRKENAPESNRGISLAAKMVDAKSPELERVFKAIDSQ